MKELSLEDKARAYDKAIEVAQRFYNNSVAITKKGLEDIFPELAESGDERIRKSLSAYFAKFKSNDMWDADFSFGDIVTWIEKQCEQKSLDDVAKEITKNKETAISFLKSTGIINENGELADEYKIEQGEQKPSEWHREDEQNLNACLGYIPDEFLRRWLTDIIHVKYDKPGDKVEPKFKVKYAGSEYNVLDIKDIAGVTYYEIEDEPNHIDYVLPNHCKIVSEHKSFWSEEDERLRRKLIELIYAASYCDERENLSDWLKSLKERYTWKPSKEQIEYISKAIFILGDEGDCATAAVLCELRDNLKKLREE